MFGQIIRLGPFGWIGLILGAMIGVSSGLDDIENFFSVALGALCGVAVGLTIEVMKTLKKKRSKEFAVKKHNDSIAHLAHRKAHLAHRKLAERAENGRDYPKALAHFQDSLNSLEKQQNCSGFSDYEQLHEDIRAVQAKISHLRPLIKEQKPE